LEKKKAKRRKLEGNEKMQKKKKEYTVDYNSNPQCFVCGGTVITPHHLDIVKSKEKTS
jgi:hypothetical protein